jgi:hypothetical protein
MNKAVNQNQKFPLHKIGHYAFLGINALVLAAGVFVIWKAANDVYQRRVTNPENMELVTEEDFNKSLEYLDKQEEVTDDQN